MAAPRSASKKWESLFKDKDLARTGWLSKRGAYNKAFKRRYFRLLSSGALCYFKDDKASKSLGVIELVGSEVRPGTESDRTFEVSTAGGRVFVLQADDAKAAKEWFESVTKVSPPEKESIQELLVCGEEGWLEKRGRVNKSFKRRYFRLFTNEQSGPVFLQYFKDEKSPSPLGSIELKQVMRGEEETLVRLNTQREFSVSHGRRVYTLRGQNSGDTTRWVKALHGAISWSKSEHLAASGRVVASGSGAALEKPSVYKASVSASSPSLSASAPPLMSELGERKNATESRGSDTDAAPTHTKTKSAADPATNAPQSEAQAVEPVIAHDPSADDAKASSAAQTGGVTESEEKNDEVKNEAKASTAKQSQSVPAQHAQTQSIESVAPREGVAGGPETLETERKAKPHRGKVMSIQWGPKQQIALHLRAISAPNLVKLAQQHNIALAEPSASKVCAACADATVRVLLAVLFLVLAMRLTSHTHARAGRPSAHRQNSWQTLLETGS